MKDTSISRRFQHFDVLVRLIVSAQSLKIFEIILRSIYHNEQIEYFSLLNSFVLMGLMLFVINGKDRFAFLFAIFFFSLKALGSLTAFYVQLANLNLSAIFSSRYSQVMNISDVLVLIISIWALYLLLQKPSNSTD